MSALSPCGLPCDIDLTPSQLLRMLVRVDENGCFALAVKQIEDSTGDCTQFVDCDLKGLSWQQMVMSLIYFDEAACPAVRVLID